ncbi:MAG: hypothetical protein KatS3mg065_0187 [Chloroflexota bacterium]|nr:MAG: hypothetical protein KatS3mg065_0187 [Chloroflexota bacterium]
MAKLPTPELPEPVEDLLKEPIRLGWYRVAEPPVRYRAYELGERLRFGWTIPPLRSRLSLAMLPAQYAITLRLSPFGDWRLVEAKPFEFLEDARRWAAALWRDAVRGGWGSGTGESGGA